jgi:hypothetical protein
MKKLFAYSALLLATQAIAQSGSIAIIDKSLFEGPDGLRLSCHALACFDDANAHGAGVFLRDSSGRETSLNMSRGAFNVGFANWTPAIADFLKSSIDQCASNAQGLKGIMGRMGGNNTFCSMSPARAKDLIDRVYVNATAIKEQQAQRKIQAEASTLATNQEAESRTLAIQSRLQDDERNGYKHMSFTDFQLDNRSMPPGSKVALTGFYQVSGQVESLVETPIPDAFKLVLLTETAPRESRKRFLECRNGICRMTVLGHTSTCEITWLGKPVSKNVCLVVDDTWSKL